MIDKTYLTQTLSDLVSINSINPSLVAGGAGEAEIAAYYAGAMAALGLEAHVDHLEQPGRANAVGVLRSRSGRGRSLLWNGHMDTVGENGMRAPFTPEIREGRLYGRGSQDMKGSLAAMLAAVKALKDESVELDGDLILTGVADEEMASLGSEDIVRRYRADAAIVTEPTDLALSTAHRGFIGFEVRTHGRAAHGSRYQEGIDAILMMGRFLQELDELERELRARPPHALVGPPSLHASTIQGGTEMSTYPAECLLMIERRTIPGEQVPGATAEVQLLLERCAAKDATFRGDVVAFIDRPPFEIDPQAEIVRAIQAAQTGRGLRAAPQGVSFWTDAALFAEAGIPCALIGPRGHGLHSAEEWVDLKSCVELAEILKDCAVRFCNRQG